MRSVTFSAALAALALPAPAPAQQTIYGSWCATLGNGWPYDAPGRALVVGQDGSCRWDLAKKAEPGKAKDCSVKPSELTLTTGSDSKVGAKLLPNDTLDGWFQLKNGGQVYRFTGTRGACSS